MLLLLIILCMLPAQTFVIYVLFVEQKKQVFIVLWSIHDCAIYLIYSHCCLVS